LKINFEQVHIRSMTLMSSTLQIRKYEYSGDLTIIVFVGIDTLSFYVINCEFVRRFILFVFSDFRFVLYWCTL